MKRHLFLFFLFLLSATALAQSGLSVSPYFDDDFVRNSTQTSISLKGEKVKPYKLSLFRSITLSSQGEDARHVERAVLSDAAHAIEHEAGRKEGKLYYGFYRLPPENGQNRYLFYRNNALRKGGEQNVILIYMEGKATIAELKRHFGK